MSTSAFDPPTRKSLIVRLRDPRDVKSWSEFTALYEPVIYRLASARGMQDADAREIVQEVLVTVATAVDRFDVEANGSFRGWLSRVTRNAAIDHFRKASARECATGGPGVDNLVDPVAPDCLQDEFDRERRRQLFRWAAGQVRERTGEVNWLAFWRTAVEAQAVAEVARELGIGEGQIYAARCRILKRIRLLVAERLEE